MTLLITLIAAVVCTVIWYKNAPEDKMQVSEYIETEAEFFSPSAYDMLNDAFLGISAVALGLVIWIVKLLITDPKHIFRKK